MNERRQPNQGPKLGPDLASGGEQENWQQSGWKAGGREESLVDASDEGPHDMERGTGVSPQVEMEAQLQAEADRSREVLGDGPRIYVASLSDYNAGILHGRWLEANQELEQLEAEVAAMLAESPTAARFDERSEEYAIHDYEGFGDAEIGEYERLEGVVELGSGIVDHGPAFAAWWLSIRGQTDARDPGGSFETSYQGSFSDLEEFGWKMLEDMGLQLDEIEGVPEFLRSYIRFDAQGWTRDMLAEGIFDVVEHKDGIWVFQVW